MIAYLYNVRCTQTGIVTKGVVSSSPANAIATLILCKIKDLTHIPENDEYHHKHGMTYQVYLSPRVLNDIHIKRWRKNAYEAEKVQFNFEIE
jgi:hypothetical protein